MGEIMKTTCKQFDELLDLRAAGWLSADEAGELERHLLTCPSCREQARLAKHAAGLIGGRPAPPAPVVRVTALTRRRPAQLLKWAWFIGPALAACLVVLLRLHAPGPDDIYRPEDESHARQAGVAELAAAPPTLATYNRAILLHDSALDDVLNAHDRSIQLHEPYKPGLSFPDRRQQENRKHGVIKS